MKIEEIAIVGALVYLLSKMTGAAGALETVTQDAGARACFGSCGGVNDKPPASTEVTTQRIEYIYQNVPVYNRQVYQTEIPVVPSEYGVSQGVPTGSPIPLAPNLVAAPRFSGDTQVLTQCPRGQLQGGSPSTMNYLLTSRDAAAVAWRARFCD
jgi:hypothetical protein